MRRKFVKNLILDKIREALRKIFVVRINPIDWMIRYNNNTRIVRIFMMIRNHFQNTLKEA